jgi:hypothetical protein
MRTRRLVPLVTAATAALTIGAGAAALRAQDAPREVRQIVTFRYPPSGLQQALTIYEQQLLPIYRELSSLVRFRGYREVESPEPLDLVVVSTYRGMAGMDRANDEMRRVSRPGPGVPFLYRRLAELGTGHHDQFVEMLRTVPPDPGPPDWLDVFEYLRVVPDGGGGLEQVLATRAAAWEEGAPTGLLAAETGRLLVSDGWDYLRIYRVRNLAGWQAYLEERRQQEWVTDLERHVAARKVIILREAAELRVR